MRDSYSITEICQALGLSPSAYYAARGRTASSRTSENASLLKEIVDIHQHRHKHCYGSPRMTHELQARGHSCSENRVARIMRVNAIRAYPRRSFRPRTTCPDRKSKPSPNKLTGAPVATAPGQHVVSDITYIPTSQGWLYLAIVLDLKTRYILGWKLSDSMSATLVISSLQQAHDHGLFTPSTIFHSDRGSQYSARPTRELIRRLGLTQSMSAKGYCYDNAFAESAFASIKSELPPSSLGKQSAPLNEHRPARPTLRFSLRPQLQEGLAEQTNNH